MTEEQIHLSTDWSKKEKGASYDFFRVNVSVFCWTQTPQTRTQPFTLSMVSFFIKVSFFNLFYHRN
jgi:hypothetical protein